MNLKVLPKNMELDKQMMTLRDDTVISVVEEIMGQGFIMGVIFHPCCVYCVTTEQSPLLYL